MSTDETSTIAEGLAATKVQRATDEAETRLYTGAHVFSPSEEELEEQLEQIRQPLSQRLELQERIARGGMGQVEIVVDHALERRLARKVIHPDLQKKRRTLWLFIREARITAQLDHPNIVPVHDIGQDEDGIYFTMKRVDGRTLTHVFADLPVGRLPRETLFKLLEDFIKVCDALAFAHSRGVLHCDLKPDNIMVGDFGQVYLMDWGVARVLDPSGEVQTNSLSGIVKTLASGAIMGTPNYMSPEQALGLRGSLDERSDVFSLGAILYQLLTGRPPYTGKEFDETLKKAQRGDYVVPSEMVGPFVIPPALERIVLKAMNTDPAARYQTVIALVRDLRTFMRGGHEFPRITYRAGEHIVREGDEGDTAYIVASGRCEIYRMVDGEHQTLTVLGPGQVFGETAILTSGPRTASVVALEDETQLYVLSAEDLEGEIADMKPWLASLVRSLANRFRKEMT
ncbi:MAG: cyclic nucleotide-binding domain-containing protein [Myxococcales bacterium]|nr:cyclic nucleotide-binding domain-containing protein [Myxococcales bacterium]